MFKRSLYSVSIRGAEVSLHFQGWLLQIIYVSFTYKLDCCNTGGLKTWGHSANLHLRAFTLEHSVQGSLLWCPLTVPWVQCSAEAFTNRKGTAVVCEKCDLQYGRAWVGFDGRTLMFSQKVILDMVLECPDRVSVSDHCLRISFFPQPALYSLLLLGVQEWKGTLALWRAADHFSKVQVCCWSCSGLQCVYVYKLNTRILNIHASLSMLFSRAGVFCGGVQVQWSTVKGIVEPWKDVYVRLLLHVPYVMKLPGSLFSTKWSSVLAQYYLITQIRREQLICGLSCISFNNMVLSCISHWNRAQI